MPQYTPEEIRQKIEAAQNAGDDRAVQALEGYLQTLETPPAPEPEQPALTPGATTERINAESDPIQYEGALSNKPMTEEQRTRDNFQSQYERDQILADEQRAAGYSQFDLQSRGYWLQQHGFDREHSDQDVIRDPETGEWRFSALSPEMIEDIENPSGLTMRSALGAVSSGLTRQVGQRVESIDEGIEVRRSIQGFLWDQLPSAEQDRIRNAIAEDAGVDVERVTPERLAMLSAYKFKQYFDQNPDNQAILDSMMGDEADTVYGERWRRIGNRISAVVPGMPLNVFGAQETMGDVIGRGAYEDIDVYGGEGRAPLYPGASSDIGDWLTEARRDTDETFGGIYERLIRPALTTEEGRLPGQSITAGAQFIREHSRSERQAESADKPFFPEDMTWRDSLNPDFWTDPDTKLPWNDFTGFSLTFLETSPQIAEGIIAARMGGRVGASQAVRHYAGSTLQRIEQARRNWAMTGGVITGGTAEGLMIRDEVASDIRHTLMEVPMEKFREDPVFQAMVAAGYTEEEARQVLISDSSRVGGDTAFWVAGVAAGSPMSAVFGRMGAGRVGVRTTAQSMLMGGLGEGLQEGTQEVIEGEISDWRIRDLDPENPIFSNPNRRLERFGGGFFTGGPIGALTSIESQRPAGLQEENQEAMEATMRYMEATNERVRYERDLPMPQESSSDPIGRLKQLEKLEQLQLAEANALLEGYDTMREYFEANPSQTSKAEIKMLNALRMRANATLTDIATARSRRQTATEMVEEQENILRERAALQRQVTEDMMTLEDINRQLADIEAVQNNEPVSEQAYEELLREGYGRWTNKNKDKFVLTPKGKRATNLLNQQRDHMSRKLEEGYRGPDRRQGENVTRRALIDQAGPAQREEMLFTDSLTGVQNRRAFNERQEHIDVREGEAKRNIEAAAPAVAAVDVDGLAWVNDNMGHAAGDRLLQAVSDAIGDQKGVEVFRLGGDEFAITGASEQALENAMQLAAKRLQGEKIADNDQEITPQITWGKGRNYEQADLQAGQMKRDRVQRGTIADRKAKPTTWQPRAQQQLFQKEDVIGKEATLTIRPYHPGGKKSMAGYGTSAFEPFEVKGTVSGTRDVYQYAEVTTENGSVLKFNSRGHLLVTQNYKPKVNPKDARILEVIDALGKRQKKYGSHPSTSAISINRFGGLFQLDEGEQIASDWKQVRNEIRRRDFAEILTPTGAVPAIVTKINRSRSRPRVEVTAHGRKFRFNPERNHLITHNTDPADIAWLTGEEQFSDPLYGPLPQVIQDVQIGHLGHMDGKSAEDFYADLGFDISPQQQLPWWVDTYPEWDTFVPYVPPLPVASEEETARAEAVVDALTMGYENLPKINLISDMQSLKDERPEIVEQMVSEGGTNILRGARGYMNHENPQDGIYIFVPNIRRIAGDKNFAQGIAETLMHEMIGHYGVRGFFGNEAELRGYMLDLVNAFPTVASRMSKRIGVSLDTHAGQQLVGEEMVAYLAGEVLSGKRMNLNQKQKTLFQKIVDWVKQWLVKHGWATPEDIDTDKGFWNDERVQTLIARSQDFVNNGKGFEWTAFTGQRVRFMRDADMFQQGIVSAINTGTRKVTNAERKQLANKFGGRERVPTELPLFPEVGSPNAYRQAMVQAVKDKHLSNLELRTSGLDEKSGDWAFLRDGTYGDIKRLMLVNNPDLTREWYREVLPYPVAQELDAIYAAQDKAYMVGPIRQYDERPVLNAATVDLTKARIAEIMGTVMNQKKTQLTKDIMLAHAASNKALRVKVQRAGGHPRLSTDAIGQRLFGEMYDPDQLSPMGRDMIKEEQRLTEERGPDIGYSEQARRWNDWVSSHSYAEYSPQGARHDSDYRVAVILQEGSHEMGVGRSSHYEQNLFHIRTGTAELLDMEGAPIIPDAPNPDMQNKFLSMIELQSDWLQALRTSYSTATEKEQAEAQMNRNRNNLRSMSQGFVQRMSVDLWAEMDNMLKPIYNLPEGRLQQAYEAYASEEYAMPFDELPQESKDTAYREFMQRQMNPIIEKIVQARGELGALRTGDIIGELPGTLDARMFDALDRHAAGQVAQNMYEDFDNLVRDLQNAQTATSQSRFVDLINDAKSSFMRRTHRYAQRGSSEMLRLPYAAENLKTMLGPVFNALGVPMNALTDNAEALKQIETANLRVPVQRIKDYARAAFDEDGVVSHVQNMFANGRLLDNDINPNGMNFSYDSSEDADFVEITVSGSKEQIDSLHQKLPDLVKSFVENNGSAARANRLESNRRIRERERQREMRRTNTQRTGEVTWDEVSDETDMEEIDVDDPSNAERSSLSEYGVDYYENYEESRLPDIRDEIISEAFANMDWDDVVNEDGESLHPTGEEFRSRVYFDDDGDADTSDAWAWLNEAREAYRQEMYEDDTYYDQAYEQVRDAFFEDPPALWLGSLPYSWDEDGDVDDTVPIRIESQEVGDMFDVYIEGEEYASESTLSSAQNAVAGAIESYYSDQDITPPPGTLFSPRDTQTEEMFPDTLDMPERTDEEVEALPDPNWEMISNAIIDESAMISGKPERADKMFDQYVSISKRISNGTIKDTPLADDNTWRAIALKYLLSDAVRRGFPGIIWNNGLSSARRGGNWGMSGTIKTSRLLWTQETMTLRGQTHDMLVIRSPDMEDAFVVDGRKMIPILGRDLSAHIMGQINGNIPLMPEEAIPDRPEPGDPRSEFLVSETEGGTHVAIYDRNNGQFISFAQNDEDSINAIVQGRSRDIEYLRPVDPDVEAVGEEITMQGMVTQESFGSPMRIITGSREYGYEHTFGMPRLASARTSYEEVTHRAWEKELKKYGAEIKEVYVSASDLNYAENKEGQPTKRVDNRDERIRQTHGEVSIQELTGETHGWVVMSERSGPLSPRAYSNRDEAADFLRAWKEDNFGRPGGGVKVNYIEINEKLREEFSGPVAPFHYDPKNDPDLANAAEKIGYEDVSFREKWRAWRQAWSDNWQQGMFDRFYGIKRALKQAGEKQEGYVETRLTTSLDSVMKAVLEYGPPMWDRGMTRTMENEKGLLEIFQPVMKQIDLWGMYMVGVRAKRLMAEGREKLFTPEEIDSMVALGDKYPAFKRVAAEYARFNKLVLDYATEAGVINSETRALWENADYIPFYRVEDKRMVGPFSGGAGIANQRSPIKRLKGGEANIGNPIHNIMMNLTNLMDSSMKNHAALTTVDALKGSGIVSKEPMAFSAEVIPLAQVKKMLIDRGMNPDTIPPEALTGFQKMFAIKPPEGPGVISVLRNGKKEFYYTDDELLYRAMTSINKKAWGRWMNIWRYPKRLLTTFVTLDPSFMAANYIRDTLSAFVISRDNFIPVAAGIKGFGQALVKDKAMRTMLSAGAAFESGYINQYDPQATEKLLKKKMKNKGFARTVINSPAKLLDAWKALGSATENANRMAVYNAAIAAGKSEKQAAFEAKDLMDFSMSGDWPVIQFLVQSVPFMGARMQGLHRLGRGFVENPLAFSIKGTLVGMAGMALWLAFRDDERYQELEEWDKDTYFHWWIGDNHYRLPKPFEVGAIFNTIPERIMEYIWSNENDAGQLLLKRLGHMFHETFNMSPIPQTLRPMVESFFNYNFFQGRSIVSPYEQQRMAPEEYRYTTSPTMIEIARALPSELDTVSGKIRSPLHLQNLYYGYTATLGKYFMMATDAVVRDQADYPNPPEWRISDWPVIGRFVRGDEPRRTKYEEEVYRLINRVTEIQGSLRMLEKTDQIERWDEIATEYEPYIRVSRGLEQIRSRVSDINQAIMQDYMSETMTPQEKRESIDRWQQMKNELFEQGWALRPSEQQPTPITQQDVRFLIEQFGEDEAVADRLEQEAPDTLDLVNAIDTLGMRELQRLASTEGGQ